MPEGRAHHVLDGARLAVGKRDLDLLSARTRFTGWFRRPRRSGRRRLGPWPLGFRCYRFSIPLGIVEVVMRLHEIVDGEVILAVVESRAASDDLLELDHRVDRSHQDDIAEVAGVHP